MTEDKREPIVPMRGIYWASHFYTPYEVLPIPDLKEELKRLADRGANWLMTHYPIPQYYRIFDPERRDEEGVSKWNRLKEIHAIAGNMGFSTAMGHAVNTAWRGQVPDDATILASPVSKEAMDLPDVGKLLCPSTKEGREICLLNREELYRDMPQIDMVIMCAYDDCGCFCEKCTPAAETFFYLTKEFADLLHKYHPSAKVYPTDWGMNLDEVDMWVDLFDKGEDEWIDGILSFYRPHHIVDKFSRFGIGVGCMPENAMIGGWGAWGANPLPQLVHKRMQCVKSGHIKLVAPYSECLQDDINTSICLSMSQNPEQSVEDVLREYAREQLQVTVEAGVRAFVDLALTMEKAYLDHAEPGLWVSGIRAGRWAEREARDGFRKIMLKAQELLKRLKDCVPVDIQDKHWWQSLAIQVELYTMYAQLETTDEVNQSIRRVAARAHMALQCAYSIDGILEELAGKLQIIRDRHNLIKRMRSTFKRLREDVYKSPKYECGAGFLATLETALKEEKSLLMNLEKLEKADGILEIAPALNSLRRDEKISDLES